MAASAYAALVSLSRILKQILHPSKKHWIRLDTDQIMSLDKKVGSLVHLLEDLSNRRNSSKFITDELMNQMTNAGHEAEDIIDSYVAKIYSAIKRIESDDDDESDDYESADDGSVDDESAGHESADDDSTEVENNIKSIESAHNDESADDDPAAAEVENRIRELSTHFCEDIKRVSQTMDLINQNLIQIQTKMDDDTLSRSGGAAPSQSSNNNVKNVVMVGFEDQLLQMIDKLTNTAESKLQIIPIVGMGGLGKTTLAKNIYDKSIIVDYFPARAWVTLSQTYTVRQVLVALLCDALNKKQEEFTKEVSRKNDEELGDQFRKSLFGRRYLIVIDDIWSTTDWDRLKKFFPDNKNGSRIMMTTRLSNVASSLGSAHNSHALKFLNEDKSWNLFCDKVFPGQGCWPLLELEEIGRKIAKSCRGLPLAIVAIGGLLANSNKTPEYWEYVAENLNSIINSGDDEHCLKLLSLSYNDLPIYLKPCFLYMAMFPEDCEIKVNRLVRLWVAEGFLKPIKDTSLEDVAMVYLKELIDRNLILVGERGWRTGRMKSCKIHDVLRDLCIREAHKESFLCVIRSGSSIENNNLKGIESSRRLAIHQNNTGKPSNCPEEDLINALKCATNARTLLCGFEWISASVVPSLNLVRVLDVVEDKYSAEEITKLSSLRYIAFKTELMSDSIPSVIPQWNLQTFICTDVDNNVVEMPSLIWEMAELRHIKFDGYFELPDPPTPTSRECEINGTKNDSYILENLQTLERVYNLRWSEEVVKRVPNLRNLKIDYDDDDDDEEDEDEDEDDEEDEDEDEDVSVPRSGEEWGTYYGINNLVLLHKLESLTLDIDMEFVMTNIAFPRSLRILDLSGCGLAWSDIKIVSSLPLLESLVISENAFVGTTWDAAATSDDQGEGELFVRLKVLAIYSDDLKYWAAMESHFPMLENLYLKCPELEEIPLGFAGIPTLQSIKLTGSKPCAIDSARNILEERENLGYEGLLVQYWNGEEGCWEMVEMDGDEDD